MESCENALIINATERVKHERKQICLFLFTFVLYMVKWIINLCAEHRWLPSFGQRNNTLQLTRINKQRRCVVQRSCGDAVSWRFFFFSDILSRSSYILNKLTCAISYGRLMDYGWLTLTTFFESHVFFRQKIKMRWILLSRLSLELRPSNRGTIHSVPGEVWVNQW